MSGATELIAMWLPEGLYLSPPPPGYLEEYNDLIFAELDPLIARHPDTGETVVEAHVWIIDTPDLPADREAGMLTEAGMKQLLESATDYTHRLKKLSPKHRAAFQIILNTPTAEFRALGWVESPDSSNLKAKDAFKTMHRLGYVWDGERWKRDSQKQ